MKQFLRSAKELLNLPRFHYHSPPSRPPTWYDKLSAYYHSHLETVPYTNRTRFIIFPASGELRCRNYLFKLWKFKSKILPSTHPDSCRIQHISDRIIRAAIHRGVISNPVASFDWQVVTAAKQKGLCGICFPAGKIIIFPETFKFFSTDAGIALVVAHEVAHSIARHHSEFSTMTCLFVLPSVILTWMTDYTGFLSSIYFGFYVNLIISKRMEIEADYIGLMLYANAGYDPRGVLKILEKHIGNPNKSSKRLQLAYEAMDEALAIYREGIAACKARKMFVDDV